MIVNTGKLGVTISLVAASMGAAIIEKHITRDRRQRGPDHKVSLEPYELKRLIRDIRTADQGHRQGEADHASRLGVEP